MTERTEPEIRSVVLEAWCSGFGVDEATASVDDDFFALGGDSLLLVEVLEQIESALGIEVPLPDLFVDPSLGHLLELCEQRVPTAPGA
jgi:phthiocerol/phenolphthiocerol synthesis type-I polyketide synthase E